MTNSPHERRQFLRVYRNFIMSYHEKGKPSVSHDVSQVNNVSKGGLNFSSTHALTKGAVLAVDLKTPFITGSIKLEGVILECREKIPDMIYEVRLQFSDIPREALTVLEKIEKYAQER